MAECFNTVCPYCVDYSCKRTATCDMRLDGEYVKIVRCKDCKHNGTWSCMANYGADEIMTMDDNDYCSWGVRKDEAEE